MLFLFSPKKCGNRDLRTSCKIFPSTLIFSDFHFCGSVWQIFGTKKYLSMYFGALLLLLLLLLMHKCIAAIKRKRCNCQIKREKERRHGLILALLSSSTRCFCTLSPSYSRMYLEFSFLANQFLKTL